MEIPKIHEGEYRFCLIMWEHEPISAAQLVKLCQEQLGWKRTTTYTVIKRLGERGVLKNEDGIVTALVSKDEAQAVKAKLFCPEIAGLFCRIAGLFCHDSRANLSLKPVCFGIAIS